MCGKYLSRRRPSFWRWLVLAAALISGIASATAQDTQPAAPTSEPSETAPPQPSPPSTMQRWDDIETRLETLYEEARASSTDWDSLLTELAQVRAEVERLRLDSQKSLASFEAYERRTSERIASIEARAAEEAARADRAERSRDTWRAVGLAGLAMLLLDIIIRILSI